MVLEAPMNKRIQTHDEIMARHGEGERWAERLIEDGRNRAVWISGPPGTPPDPHIHPDFNEWWIALDGSTQWQIGQYEPVRSSWGDVIMAPAGYCHIIEPKEGVQAIRFGVTHPNSNHDIKGIAPCRYLPVDEGQSSPNLIHTKLKDVVSRNGSDSNWTEVIVSDDRNYGTYIHEIVGTSSDANSHAKENRWWVVLQGSVEWDIEGEGVTTANAGDVVFIESGKIYSTKTVGEESTIRVSIEAPKG
jgi:mannose-6-phosphate isomerase-like protein (cupin superfamily)